MKFLSTRNIHSCFSGFRVSEDERIHLVSIFTWLYYFALYNMNSNPVHSGCDRPRLEVCAMCKRNPYTYGSARVIRSLDAASGRLYLIHVCSIRLLSSLHPPHNPLFGFRFMVELETSRYFLALHLICIHAVPEESPTQFSASLPSTNITSICAGWHFYNFW